MLDDSTLKQVKAETLCWGIALSEQAKIKVLELYPLLLDEVHIHAAHIFIDGRVPVNAVLAEEYSSTSPYELYYLDKKFVLFRYGKRICDAAIRPAPTWYQKRTSLGTPMSNIFTVHGARTIALAKYVRCDYINANQACQFCSVPITHLKEKDRIKEIEETYQEAFKFNPAYTIALSEGARFTPDRGALYHVDMVYALKRINPAVSISVELVPPKTNDFIDMLIDMGVNSLIMNVEFYDEIVRKKLMPAKSQVSVLRYFEAWEYAVSKLGWGQVSSVAILGIEDPNNTLYLAKQMVKRGVIPTLMPFRPYDNTPMKSAGVIDPQLYLSISDKVSKWMLEFGLHPALQHGCAECGACSLEIDYAFIKPMKSSSNGWIPVDTL